MTNLPTLPRATGAAHSSKKRITAAGPFSLFALTLTSLLGGCAATEPMSHAIERPRPVADSAASFLTQDMPRIGDEIRLMDTRVIRALRQPQPYQDALSLTPAQKTVVIVAGAVVGAYLLGEFLEDNLALPPGP